MFSIAFLKGLGERAIKTFAQALAAFIAAGATGILDIDWKTALSVAGLATVASILTSLGNADFTAGDSAPVATIEPVVDDSPDDGEDVNQAADEVDPAAEPDPGEPAPAATPAA